MTPERPDLMIGEFARRCRLPVSTLRYYDRIGLLAPAVVDPATGYRRYAAEQLAPAVLISRLRAIGTTPRDISRVLAGGPEAAEVLAGERRRIEGQIRRGQRAVGQLDDLLAEEHGAAEHRVELVELVGEHVAALPVLAPSSDLGPAVLRAVAALRSTLRRAGCPRTPPWGAAFPLQVSERVSGFVFTRTARKVHDPGPHTIRLPAARVAQTLHRAGPDSLWLAYRSALDTIEAHGGRPSGPVIEEYLSLDAPHTRGTSIRVSVPLAP